MALSCSRAAGCTYVMTFCRGRSGLNLREAQGEAPVSHGLRPRNGATSIVHDFVALFRAKAKNRCRYSFVRFALLPEIHSVPGLAPNFLEKVSVSNIWVMSAPEI
jgi:hypothetical protein